MKRHMARDSATGWAAVRPGWVDLLIIAAAPLYIVVATLVHEGSHALFAMAMGGTITNFEFLYRCDSLGMCTYGRVRYVGVHSSLITAAPFLIDLVKSCLGALLIPRIRKAPRWLWINLCIVTLGMSLVDSLWNYARTAGDVTGLLAAHPDWLVHTAFLTSLTIQVGLVLVVLRFALHGRPNLSRRLR